MTKAWIREFIWIAAIFVIAVLIDFLIFKQFSLFTDTIDIQLHDTYFVIGGVEWVFYIFILIATPTYLIKEAKVGYNQRLPNVILSILLIVLLFFMLGWHRQLYALQTLSGGWTVYPPLDALPGATQQAPDSSIGLWEKVLFVLELLIMIGLFLLGYKTGKLKEKE